MNDYVEVRIDIYPLSEDVTDITDITDVAAAMLADAGYESFVPDEKGLTAYIKSSEYSENQESILVSIPFAIKYTWQAKDVEGRDWNHEWEKNYFKPIVVGDKCVIHSTFHKDIPSCQYDIVIDPKMAFGTGHHSTTWLIISQLLEADLEGKRVVDMGTGTGILAILSLMRGAAEVTGIEIDEAAYNNALENRILNGYPNLRLILGDASSLSLVTYKADLLLANINRNVITNDIKYYADALRDGGSMLLSGFYFADMPIVAEAARKCGMKVIGYTERVDWVCMQLVKA